MRALSLPACYATHLRGARVAKVVCALRHIVCHATRRAAFKLRNARTPVPSNESHDADDDANDDVDSNSNSNDNDYHGDSSASFVYYISVCVYLGAL